MWGPRRFPTNKKYIVRLTDQERDELATVIKKLKGTSQKMRRAQIDEHNARQRWWDSLTNRQRQNEIRRGALLI
jgi:hypothetical protein